MRANINFFNWKMGELIVHGIYLRWVNLFIVDIRLVRDDQHELTKRTNSHDGILSPRQDDEIFSLSGCVRLATPNRCLVNDPITVKKYGFFYHFV